MHPNNHSEYIQHDDQESQHDSGLDVRTYDGSLDHIQGVQALLNGFFNQGDLKSKDSKYKRWSPKMDQYLIKLLVDVVRSYPKDSEPEMTKRSWAYVTSQLRYANPETVYSTYTKYSCQQHLFNVNHHRYKIWYLMILHSKASKEDRSRRQTNNHDNNHNNINSSVDYLYQWSVEGGKFEIFDEIRNNKVEDERQIKALIYGGLSLPILTSFNKSNLILNDFFLTDNLKYMTSYHNLVLPLLLKLDSSYGDGLGDIYSEIPKFENNGIVHYLVPLPSTKASVIGTSRSASKLPLFSKKRTIGDTLSIFNENVQAIDSAGDTDGVDEVNVTVDPALKKLRQTQQARQQSHSFTNTSSAYFENELANAAIAAINSPPVLVGKDISIPIYIKDRKWFNKLIYLNEISLVTSHEVLTICEGVRDGKIPLFMLNILDQSYYVEKIEESVNNLISDDEIVKKIREFMIPLAYS